VKAARRELTSGADVISLCAIFNEENCFYYPTAAGRSFGWNGKGRHWADPIRALTAAGVDPFGTALGELRRGQGTVLAKLRMNDCHFVAGVPWLRTEFWRKHPQWRIGNIEKEAGGGPPLSSLSCVGDVERQFLAERRPPLLDYAVPEVRQNRLALVRELLGRYDVAGLTLNFLREPYCVSFPSKNAHHLIAFVAECRKIVDKVARKQRHRAGILGAIMPWDLEYCRAMGLKVDKWIADGLLDYVSPTDTWV
jgi:hypothetical protein